MSEKAQTTKDRLTKHAHEGIESASNAVHPTIDRAATGAHSTVDSADQFADQAGEGIGNAGAKGEELVDASTSYVREHPLLSMGLAVTAGYVLSTLLSSR